MPGDLPGGGLFSADDYALKRHAFEPDEFDRCKTCGRSSADTRSVHTPGLSDRFLVPPFTLLDTRQDYWQKRRRMWLELGIRGETGREGGLTGNLQDAASRIGASGRKAGLLGASGVFGRPDIYDDKARLEAEAGHALSTEEVRRIQDIGRPGGLIYQETAPAADPSFYSKKRAMEAELGRELTTAEFKELRDPGTSGNGYSGQSASMVTGTSVFDPVLCELVYRWWSGEGARVLDPFAGGVVRGLVAGALGREYEGIELRPEQIADNRAQAAELLDGGVSWGRPVRMPIWHEHDSTRLDELGLAPVDLVFTCHPAGTRVTTARGSVPIEAVEVGDSVLTHSGNWRAVTECLAFAYDGQMAEIKRAYCNLPLRATADHLLLVRRDGECNWRYACDVVAGDWLVEPRPQAPSVPLDGEVIWEYERPYAVVGQRGRGVGARVGVEAVVATPAAARLVGYYLAEGCTPGNSVSFAFGPDEDAYIADVLELVTEVLGLRCVERPQSPTNRVRVLGASGIIGAEFFREAGARAAEKRFPQWVWACSDDILREVVCGAWRGDGWVCVADGDLGFATTSGQLAEDLRRALLRLGIPASVHLRPPRPTGYSQRPLPQWGLSVRGCHADALAAIVGVPRPASDRKQRPGRSPEVSDTHVYYKVESNQAYFTDGVRDVYNLEVEVDHSYLAEGVASHNCPPYADLEVYSSDPRDISTRPYDEFTRLLGRSIALAAAVLKPNRFAVWVVGEARHKKTTAEYGLVADTVKSAQAAGLSLYNSAILMNSAGSAALRAQLIFGTRKLVRLHQHVLVFVKGDPKKATEACGQADIGAAD